MDETLKTLLEEKIVTLQGELQKDRIEAKTMAEICIVFYEKYGENNYNEDLLKRLCKRVMKFFNQSIKNLPDTDQESYFDSILKKSSDIQGKITGLIKKHLDKNNRNSVDISVEEFDFQEFEQNYKSYVIEFENLKSKKPFIFFRRNWIKKLGLLYEKLDEVQLTIEELRKKQKESAVYKTMNSDFKNIMENLKDFNLEINPEIGVELASISFEDVISNENRLKTYISDVILKNLYLYFTEKQA